MRASDLLGETWPRHVVVMAGVAAIAVVVALVQSLRLWWRSASVRWAAEDRALRGAIGERRAEAIVHAHGYRVVERQSRARWLVWTDGREVSGELRADLVVVRAADGALFVAEVKTGVLAPRIETGATRRQLLEYLLAFDVDGVLLVDADRGTVHEVVFGVPEARTIREKSLAACG